MKRYPERCLVTGASSGIGKAVVHQLRERGVHVIELDMATPVEENHSSTAETSGSISSWRVNCDLRNADSVESTVSRIEEELGPIDGLAHCAGILRMGFLFETKAVDWKDTIDTNLYGTINLLTAVGRRMADRSQGSIVVVSSNAALVPRIGMGAYCASKAAVSMLTRCLGLELGKKQVRCNIVSPGTTDTPMVRQGWVDTDIAEKNIVGSLEGFKTGIPLGRIAEASEIATVIEFLLSSDARHITLADLCVDGGATLGV